jgi:hypothetical protein
MLADTAFDGYQCEICGQFHAGQYISVAFDSPDPYAGLKESDKDRAHLGTDDCVIGNDEFYLRGIIELPIVGIDETFLWGVWVRVWQKDYDEFADHYDAKDKERLIGPYKARLSNKLLGYDPGTLNLKCTLRVQPVGSRPLLMIDEPEHPLGIEQRNGITLVRARQMSALVRHKSQ